MLRLAIVFLVIALIAAFLGFGGVAALSWEGAKILFVVFLILAVLSLLGTGSEGGISGSDARLAFQSTVGRRRIDPRLSASTESRGGDQ